MSAMTSYSAMVGGKPAIVMWYEKWADDTHEEVTDFPTADVDRVVAFGANPMITWEACELTAQHRVCQLSGNTVYSDKNIAAGMFDAYVTAWAQGAKAWGKPFFLRLDHEENGNWYPWGTYPGNDNQNTPADYIAAWRHVHQIFDSVGVTNATWVWAPNVVTPYATDFASDYPGDAWVDWVALDGYNWGNDSKGDTWTSFKDVFASSYAELTSLTSKPLMFAETASVAGPGGDKASWISQGFLSDLPTYFPMTRVVIWFDAGDSKIDFRVNTSQASLDAFRTVVASPYFRAGPPLR